jgi:hypothetical protein
MLVVLLVLVAAVVVFNVIVATTMTTEEMKRDLYYSQCFIGKLFANSLYSLAWMMKLIYRDSFIEKRRAKRALERDIKSSIAEHMNGNIKVVKNYITGNVDINFFFDNGTSYPIYEGVCSVYTLTSKALDRIARKYSIECC